VTSRALPSYLTKTRPSKVSGFTLIEVMLVVLIMGLAAGFAVYTVDNSEPQNKLKRSAQRLAALTELTLDKAVLAGRDFGIAFSEKKYHFVELVEQRWQAAQDPLLKEQSLIGVTLLIEVEGFEWRPDLDSFASSELFTERDVDGELDELEKPHIPQLLILSSGELTPFVINFAIAANISDGLTQRQQQYRVDVKGNSLGLVELVVIDE